MRNRNASDWEEIARREPYFAVHSADGSLRVESAEIATAAFFQTGEEDISSLLSAIASILGRDVLLTSSLDFGCGAGRLTLPLARRAATIVGCDIAPTMLAHARRNALNAGQHNVTFIETNQLTELRNGQFDFVCSLLVFQHIPPAAGYEIMRALLRVLAAGGVAALHVTLARRGEDLRRLARVTRGKSRYAHRRFGLEANDGGRLRELPANEYDEGVVQREIDAAGARIIGRFSTNHGGTAGDLLIIQRSLTLR